MPLGGPLISVQEALGYGPEPPKPLTAKEAEAAAEVEGLTLARSDKSSTGFKGVAEREGRSRPYSARAFCNGHSLVLGYHATPQVEAALVIARRVAEEGVALAEDEHAMSSSSQEAEAAAAAAGLTIARSTRAPLASWASPRGRSRALEAVPRAGEGGKGGPRLLCYSGGGGPRQGPPRGRGGDGHPRRYAGAQEANVPRGG